MKLYKFRGLEYGSRMKQDEDRGLFVDWNRMKQDERHLNVGIRWGMNRMKQDETG